MYQVMVIDKNNNVKAYVIGVVRIENITPEPIRVAGVIDKSTYIKPGRVLRLHYLNDRRDCLYKDIETDYTDTIRIL